MKALPGSVFSLQGELFVGDQSGAIHIWDLKTDNNEQLVGNIVNGKTIFCEIHRYISQNIVLPSSILHSTCRLQHVQ